MNICHIFSDRKFVSMAMDIFSHTSHRNEYFYIHNDKSQIQVDGCTYIESSELLTLINNRKFEVLFIHGLNYKNFSLLRNISREQFIIWIGMGFDYLCYSRRYATDQFILPATSAKITNSSLKLIKNKFKKYIFSNTYSRRLIKKSLRKINIFCPVLENEGELVSDMLGEDCRIMKWNYGNTLMHYSSIQTLSINEKRILLGNSASATNNHFDAINILKDHLPKAYEIYCPLSYGDASYASSVIDYAETELKCKFMPLQKFLPLSQYNAIIESCGHVVMNHVRQQAVANIIIAFLSGANVYLNPESTLYFWLKKKNLHFFNIYTGLQPLMSETLRKDNREIIRELWSFEENMRNTNCLLKRAEQLIIR